MSGKKYCKLKKIFKIINDKRWLAGDAPASDEMKKILGPYPPGEMGVYPLSSRVNSPDAGEGQLIQPLVTLSD